MHSIHAELHDLAERALRQFSGDLDRDTAARLLPMWRYDCDLTPADRREILDRFKAGPPADPFAAQVEAALRGTR